MRDGTERKSSSSSSPSPAPDCDVGLGLRMQLQPTDSYSCGGGGGGGGGGGAFFSNNTSNPLGFMGEIYEAAAADRMVFPRGFHTSPLTHSGGGNNMPVCGKVLFTYTQWQELERQKMIHKYIMASIPVPPQLLFPGPGQDSTGRYPTATNGSDPEAWRCKRTDGKKWRCSRDVAPDQKYCERHAHKTRPRSRKHVEQISSSSHNKLNNTNIYTNSHLHPFQKSTTTTSNNLPTMAPSSTTSSYDQTRSIEWFMRGGSSNSSCNKQHQQWQQQMQRGSNTDQDKNMSVSHERIYDENKTEQTAAIGFMSLSNNIESNKTRRFIDAWGNKDGIFEKGFLSTSPSSSSLSLAMREKFSPSSLSLSMSAGNGIGDLEFNNNNNNDRGGNGSDEGMLKPQWMNNPAVSWMNDTSSSQVAPGGPLGEALCLGGGNLASSSSPRNISNGYYSNANSSSCSKRSCDDGTNAFNFIG